MALPSWCTARRTLAYARRAVRRAGRWRGAAGRLSRRGARPAQRHRRSSRGRWGEWHAHRRASIRVPVPPALELADRARADRVVAAGELPARGLPGVERRAAVGRRRGHRGAVLWLRARARAGACAGRARPWTRRREHHAVRVRGVSAITPEARNARDEFWVAIVGPLSSIALAVLLAGVWLGARAAGLDAVYPLAGYLAYVNVTVAVFNLLPGFPLDGGRVLRAVLWGARGDELSATRIASRVGRALAGGMIGGGMLLALGGAGIGAIWLVFIGWILWSAAESTYRQRLMQLSLAGVRAGDLADRNVAWVTPDTTLRDLVTERALRHGTRTFMVAAVADGDVLGLVSLSDLARFPEAQWGATSVFRAMTPRAQLVATEASTEALEALRLMVERDVNQLPVFSGGSLVGLLTRAALLRAIDVRARFGAGPGSGAARPCRRCGPRLPARRERPG
ncbi:MAG: CBS domain-containing protein [Dehalococcoidia bacterium]|nr:CBS domain-containing protein [Dehalococcoidia bacterium]